MIFYISLFKPVGEMVEEISECTLGIFLVGLHFWSKLIQMFLWSN